jgi:hypothetical protein
VKGFIVGSGILIALYVGLVNKNAVTAANTGGGILVGALQKLMSPNVAAIPQRKSAIPTASASSGGSIQAPGAPGKVPVPLN